MYNSEISNREWFSANLYKPVDIEGPLADLKMKAKIERMEIRIEDYLVGQYEGHHISRRCNANTLARDLIMESIYFPFSISPPDEREERMEVVENRDLVVSLFGLIMGGGLFFTGIFINPILSVIGLGSIALSLVHLAWASK